MNIEQNLKYICLDIINQIENYEELKTIGSFTKEVEIFRERLNDDEIRIAVVGEFSAGKSTFINALIGKDILKHATTETTAVITRIVNVDKKSSLCYTGKVIFKDKTKKVLKDLNSIKEYTSTFSSTCDVIKEINTVEIYVPLLNTKQNIVIIDTPGLNGIADGHREQTVELIKNAHFCTYLLPRRGISDSDRDFLNYIKQYQNNFIVVQNFIDTFKEAEGESVQKKIKEQTEILRNKVFNDDKNIKYYVLGLSSWQGLVSIDKDIKRYADNSFHEITDEERRYYYSKSRFDEYKRKISEIFNSQDIEEIQYGGTAWAIYRWLETLSKLINTKKESLEELYNLSQEKDSQKKLGELIDKIKENMPRQRQKVENFVVSECYDICKKETNNIQKKLEVVRDDIIRIINRENNIDILEQYNKMLPQRLEQEIKCIQTEINEEYVLNITNLYQLITMRIEEYSGKVNARISFEQFKNRWLENDDKQKVMLYQNKINKFEDERKIRREDKNRAWENYNKILEELRRAKIELEIINTDRKDSENIKNKRLRALGEEPKVEYKTEEKKVKRGGILGFLGLKKTETYEVKDTSKRDVWRDRKNKIENTYNKIISDLEGRKAAQERRLKRLQDSSQVSKDKIKRIEEDIQLLTNNIRSQKILIEQEKKYAKEEFLRKNKNKIIRGVQGYIFEQDENVKDLMIGNMKKRIDRISEQLKLQAVRLFEEAVENKLKIITEAKQADYNKWQKQIDDKISIQKILNKCMRQLEVYIQ
ncbi:dynamin family protein [uncultured Megamonas sp.]|uniref:dynamin family protein n=1 Tax=uncultured Megamonas sp. TaxID=286140 RepID=UPI00259BC37A|nr:dynamin family protein [uncultured Megamonas sp.]